MIKETDLAYAAGVIDSDGCISICNEMRNDRPHSYHRLNVRVCTIDTRLLNWFKITFGGNTYLQNKPHGNRKACYAWQKRDNPAAEFLTAILPYLIYKQDQAKVALQFREYKENHKTDRFTSISIVKEESYASQLKALHQHQVTPG